MSAAAPLPACPNPHVALAVAVGKPSWWTRAALEHEHRRLFGRDHDTTEPSLFAADERRAS